VNFPELTCHYQNLGKLLDVMRSHPVLMSLAFVAALAPGAVPAEPVIGASEPFAQRVLALHNEERERLGKLPLRWSAGLADEAQRWATSLARAGALQHAANRGGTGENLWAGSTGGYGPEQMIGAFIAERRAFRPGRFPQVSSTGNWADVGHYTQVIWPATQAVGCAVASAAGRDVMVCRYWPAGNVVGQPVG
jgi:uncharacterized protein YkwD